MSEAPPSLLPSLKQNARAEQIRDRGADMAMAVFRLTKNAMVHSMQNDAVVEATGRAAEVLREFTKAVGTPATLTFADGTVFVCGQLLRASRGIYESALELGKLLDRAGASELCFEPGISADGVRGFGEAFSTALRNPARKNALLSAEIPHVLVRKAVPPERRRRREDECPPHERAVRFYATALVVMRKFYEDMAAGKRIVPHRVKRLAQRMVVLAEGKNPALLGVTAMAAAHRDDAARSVQAAIIAVLLARQIVQDRHTLARIAMTALMADAGRVRVAALSPSALGGLSDQDEALVPAMTALVAVATGGINPNNAERAVSSFEATWLERAAVLGPLPVTGSPLPQSELLAFVRQLVDHLAPRDQTPALSPAEALDAVARRPDTSRFLLRLLIQTLGLIPVSSVVELDNGEWAVVVGQSEEPGAQQMPLLRVVADAQGRPLATPRALDLGRVVAGQRAPGIVRVLRAAEARFNVARAFMQ